MRCKIWNIKITKILFWVSTFFLRIDKLLFYYLYSVAEICYQRYLYNLKQFPLLDHLQQLEWVCLQHLVYVQPVVSSHLSAVWSAALALKQSKSVLCASGPFGCGSLNSFLYTVGSVKSLGRAVAWSIAVSLSVSEWSHVSVRSLRLSNKR